MKKLKKLVECVLALALLFALSGCGGFELRMARAAQKMSKLNSMHTDLALDADMSVSVLGTSMPLDTGLTAELDSRRDPALAAGRFVVNVMGTSQEIQCYAEERDGAYHLYLSVDGGESWSERALSSDGQGVSLSLTDQLQALAGLAALFEETGKESIGGVSAITYSGEIPAELVQQAVESAGLKEKLEDALGFALSEECFAEVGAVPVTISVAEKGNQIVRVTMELSSAASVLLQEIMASALASAGLGLVGDLGLEVSVDGVRLTAYFSEFDSAGVEVPEGIKG